MQTELPELPNLDALAQTRANVYRFLVEALDKPEPRQHEWLAGETFAADLARVCSQFDVAVPAGPLVPADYADFEARYIATFDVGLPTPPVVLLASKYYRKHPAPRVIHEHVLLYRHFGMKLADGNIEPADHLLNELAFLIHLDKLLAARPADRDSILLARRDLLTRYVADWPGQALAGAAGKDIPELYRALLGVLAAAVRQDLELTHAAAPLAETTATEDSDR